MTPKPSFADLLAAREPVSRSCANLGPGEPPLGVERPAFEDVYEAHFAFVWRNLRRLGVSELQLRDAAQDVFLVVHRRLPDFEARGSLRSWLYSIVTRVARQCRRTRRRKELPESEDAEQLADERALGPERGAEQNESLRRLVRLLDTLDDDKREAFILSDLEGMTVPEIVQTLGTNPNTIYSRIRAARSELRAALLANSQEPRQP